MLAAEFIKREFISRFQMGGGGGYWVGEGGEWFGFGALLVSLKNSRPVREREGGTVLSQIWLVV